MKIRQALQSGVGRLWGSLAVGFAAAAAIYFIWPGGKDHQLRILNGFQKVAFVAAAFGVTAYNLRTRVVDFATKVEGTPARIDEFCRIARECGTRLTNIVLIFTFSALGMAVLNVFDEGWFFTRWVTASAFGVFMYSNVQFVYFLFAFERLERLVLDEAEHQARKKEAKQLLVGSVSPPVSKKPAKPDSEKI